MRSTLLAALLTCAAFSSPSIAQTFSPERIRADVAFLADDLLEGRATGTRGYDIAARYVATRFEGIGLKPGGTDGWYQNIPFISAANDPAKPGALTLNGVRFENGNHVMVGPTIAAAVVDQSAPAVFVGYGLEDKKYGLDDYRGLDVRGKIVVYLWGTPDGLPSEVAATLNDKKGELAVSKGAAGTISIATPALLAIYPWEKVLANNALSRVR